MLKKLKIFGKIVTPKIDDISDTGLEGYFSPDDMEILISDKCKDKFSTYVHECFHAAWHRVGLNQALIDSSVQEIIVENFATFIDENFEEISHARKILSKQDKHSRKKI